MSVTVGSGLREIANRKPDGLQPSNAPHVHSDCRVLLIGPLPPPIAGDTRLFSFLVSDLTAVAGFKVDVVNSSRGGGADSAFQNFVVMLRTLLATITTGVRGDIVSFHASNRGMAAAGPILFVIAKIWRRRFICRLFGGSFDEYYATRSWIMRKAISRTVLTSDLCLFETHRLTGYFRPRAKGRVEWFSNYTRLAPPEVVTTTEQKRRCERLVFVGHMWVTKGVDVMLEALPLLPAKVTIDFYGPLDDYSEMELNERGQGRITYRGILSNAEVLSTLPDYHALVLPTFHEGEGYPGVIIEAFARGLPVVASRWQSIPEIVDESCGLLVEPKSVEGFAKAVQTLHDNDGLFLRLRKGALERAALFDHVYWTAQFAKWCGQLTLRGTS